VLGIMVTWMPMPPVLEATLRYAPTEEHKRAECQHEQVLDRQEGTAARHDSDMNLHATARSHELCTGGWLMAHVAFTAFAYLWFHSGNLPG
jgi:hypothetical protein